MDLNTFITQLNNAVDNSGTKNTILSENIIKHSTHNSIISNNADNKPNNKIKILIVSTHINQVNGYSKVIYNIITQLSKNDWIDVTHFGIQKIVNGDIGRKYPQSVKAIDGSSLEKTKSIGFAFAELNSTIASVNPDIVFIYNDMAIICAYIEEIRKLYHTRTFKIWTYIDIVYNSPPSNMIDILNRDVDRVFCFTKKWKQELKLGGIIRPIDVMNHGVDMNIIRKIPRELARKSIGLPTDIFLFSNINKNIPRKHLDLCIMAFTDLIVKFPLKPIFMFMLGDKGDKGGYSLFDIYANELKRHKVSVEMYGNRLLVASSNTAYSDADINTINNCADVGISCADGEGFGLCTLEQMSLGIPQIVPNINGYNEYCNENNSIMVTPNFRYYISNGHNNVTGEAFLVDPKDMSKAMELYLMDEDLRKLHSEREKLIPNIYTWEKCCSILIKRLKTVMDEEDD